MNKKELVAMLAERNNISKKDAEVFLDSYLDIVQSQIEEGNKVSIIGFGNFEPKTNAARMGINPSTKEKIQIKQSQSVKFKVGKGFKDRLNK